MDKIQVARDIETINKQLLGVFYGLLGAEPGSEEAEALNAIADAIMALENYLYPEAATWSDEDLYLDDGE